MSKPLNPCIRVASPDALAELQDWLASDDAKAEQLEAVIARRLIGLAREIKPTQALFVRRVGRTYFAALRPLSLSHTIGLPFAESSGPSVHEVIEALIQSLERDASAWMSNK
jgi:hypothetical protein